MGIMVNFPVRERKKKRKKKGEILKKIVGKECWQNRHRNQLSTPIMESLLIINCMLMYAILEPNVKLIHSLKTAVTLLQYVQF